MKDDGKALLQSCSLFGIYQVLKALSEKGRTATEIGKLEGIGSYAQAKKYLRLLMGLGAVAALRTRGGKGTPESPLIVVYVVKSEELFLLRFLEKFDMAKTVFREPIAEVLKKPR